MGSLSPLDALASALFSASRQKVLALLFGHPDRAFYLREIVQIANMGSGQIQRELTRLAAAGVIRRFRQGRHVYFQASPHCPVYDELRSLVLKSMGTAPVLAKALEPLARNIAVAFVYGSVARGEEQQRSDVDLMVIGDVTFADVVQNLADAESQLRREVNATVYPPSEFSSKLARDNHFLLFVMKQPKLFLLGTDRELGHLAAEFAKTTSASVLAI